MSRCRIMQVLASVMVSSRPEADVPETYTAWNDITGRETGHIPTRLTAACTDGSIMSDFIQAQLEMNIYAYMYIHQAMSSNKTGAAMKPDFLKKSTRIHDSCCAELCRVSASGVHESNGYSPLWAKSETKHTYIIWLQHRVLVKMAERWL